VSNVTLEISALAPLTNVEPAIHKPLFAGDVAVPEMLTSYSVFGRSGALGRDRSRSSGLPQP